MEVVQLLLGLGAAGGLRDQTGLAPADIARQRHHWDLVTLLQGAGPPRKRLEAAPSRGGRAFARARTASGSVLRGDRALQRRRTLSAGAVSRGRRAGLQSPTLSIDMAVHGGGVYSQCPSQSKGEPGGGPPCGGRFSAGVRGLRANPAVVHGRSRSEGVASADGPCDWVALGACGPSSNTPIPPSCFTPSRDRGSRVARGSPIPPSNNLKCSK